jgi:hypothetical protein
MRFNAFGKTLVGLSLVATSALLSVASADVIHSSDFEGTDGGWLGTGDWEVGTVGVFTGAQCDGNLIVAPPPGAASGTDAWGTVLNDCHANSSSTSVLSQTFDLSGYSSASFSWLQFVSVFFDFDTAEFFANGDKLYERTTTENTDGYESQIVDLSAYSGGMVTLEFQMSASSIVNDSGWYIDDVLLEAESEVADVSEPTLFALMLLGISGLVARRRFR